MSDLLAAALDYARRNWRVFPLVPGGKVPIGDLAPAGCHSATTSEVVIRAWWATEPQANVGVATGEKSGLLVVDVDPDAGGDETLRRLVDQHGPTGMRVVSRTGGGGQHFWFPYPQIGRLGNTAGRIGPGIDTRGEGGYVVAPPSITTDSYRWVVGPDETPMVPAPAWLLDLLADKPAERPALAAAPAVSDAYAKKALEDELTNVALSQEGSRNDTLNSAAFSLGQLVGAGLLEHDQTAWALLNAARHVGLPESEAAATIRSGMRAGMREPRQVPLRQSERPFQSAPAAPNRVESGADGQTGAWLLSGDDPSSESIHGLSGTPPFTQPPTDDLVSLADALGGYVEGVQAAARGEVRVVPTGLRDLDRLTGGGFRGGELVVLAARPGVGKAQPYDALIRMHDGRFKRMGEIEVGDRLASIDGDPSVVTAVHPQGRRQIYRITFNDGRWADCCEEHLWLVESCRFPKVGQIQARVVQTREIVALLGKERYRNRLSVPFFLGRFGEQDADLPIDPWLMGVLLGNGCFRSGSVKVSLPDTETFDRVNSILWPDYRLVHGGKIEYRIVRAGGSHSAGVCGVLPNAYKEHLEALGLWEHGSPEKFIPEQYLHASREQRMELIRGLIDTDGYVGKQGVVQFCTTSPALARQFQWLVRSVGAWCKTAMKYPKNGLPAYDATVRADDLTEFVWLPRKRERLAVRRNLHRPRLTIDSVEAIGVEAARCITVSHRSHLYLTNDYVVTHNSAAATTIARHAAGQGIGVLLVSAEMGAEQVAGRLLAAEARVDALRLRTGEVDADEWARVDVAFHALGALPIWLADRTSPPLASVVAIAERAVAEHGVGLVVVDYVGLVEVPGRDDRRIKMGVVSRALKALARSSDVPVLALSQLNREVEKRADHKPLISDLRESGDIEQDSDIVLLLSREEAFNPDTDRRGIADLNLSKNRSGPTGAITLRWLPQEVRFADLDVYAPDRGYSGVGESF